jgi:hypothetical protein
MSGYDSYLDLMNSPCSDDPRTWPWLNLGPDYCQHCRKHRKLHTGPGLDCPKEPVVEAATPEKPGG